MTQTKLTETQNKKGEPKKTKEQPGHKDKKGTTKGTRAKQRNRDNSETTRPGKNIDSQHLRQIATTKLQKLQNGSVNSRN